MKKKLTIDLAHSMREQLTEIIKGLPYISLYSKSKNIKTNKDLRKKKTKTTNRTKIGLGYFIHSLQKICGLINIKYFRTHADLSLANGGFLITNKPYLTYIEYGPQIFGYTTNYTKIISKLLLHYVIMDPHLVCIFFRTQAGYKSFINLPTLTEKAKKKVKKIGYSVYPPITYDSINMKRFINPGIFKILFIKNKFYEGGGKELLQAFIKLAKDRKNIQLTIITNISYLEKKDRDILHNHNQISLLNVSFSREELFDRFYNTHHVAVIPTYWDSFNMTINEAIATGLPVIATSFFSIPERVIDGYNGYLCSPPHVPYDKDSCVIHSFPKNLLKLVKNMRNTGKLQYIETFIYDKLLFLIEHNDRLVKMAHNSYTFYQENLDGKKQRKYINDIIMKSISNK